MGGGDGEEFQATTTQDNLEEHEPNLNQIINNTQIEPVGLRELIARAKKPIIVIIEISQHVQPIIEHVRVKNPWFFIYVLTRLNLKSFYK